MSMKFEKIEMRSSRSSKGVEVLRDSINGVRNNYFRIRIKGYK